MILYSGYWLFGFHLKQMIYDWKLQMKFFT